MVCKTTHHVEWCAEVLTDGLQSRRVHAIHGELIHRYSLTTTYRRNAKLQNIPCDLYSNQRSFPNTNAGEVKDITSYASWGISDDVTADINQRIRLSYPSAILRSRAARDTELNSLASWDTELRSWLADRITPPNCGPSFSRTNSLNWRDKQTTFILRVICTCKK